MIVRSRCLNKRFYPQALSHVNRKKLSNECIVQVVLRQCKLIRDHESSKNIGVLRTYKRLLEETTFKDVPNTADAISFLDSLIPSEEHGISKLYFQLQIYTSFIYYRSVNPVNKNLASFKISKLRPILKTLRADNIGNVSKDILRKLMSNYNDVASSKKTLQRIVQDILETAVESNKEMLSLYVNLLCFMNKVCLLIRLSFIWYAYWYFLFCFTG